MAIRKISIYDMDGTIVDSSHRYRTITDESGKERIDLQHWRDNEYRAMDDGLLPMVHQYWQDLNDPDCFVIIATARVMAKADWQFIKEILGEPDMLIHRAKDDTRSGALLKINGLVRVFNLKQFRGIPATFYEDNVAYLKAVCDRFQIQGVYVPSVQGH